MIQEMFKAFILIFIAEMGDKTQILAMAFATKYSVKKVMLGIFIGALLNHGMAVMFGRYLSTFIPMDIIQIIAGIAFVTFAIWSLKVDYDDEENSNQVKHGAVVTVAIAFFIGELGDKTQLTAITLATEASYPAFILMGTVLGMIATGGLGIFVARKLGNKIPDIIMNFIASGIFMVFGTLKLVNSLPDKLLTLQNILMYSLIMVIVVGLMLKSIYNHYKLKDVRAYAIVSNNLYNYHKSMNQNINDLCLGESKCGHCQGSNCIVGNTKVAINMRLNKNEKDKMDFIQLGKYINKKEFNKIIAAKALKETINYIKLNSVQENDEIYIIRKNLENILFNDFVESS